MPASSSGAPGGPAANPWDPARITVDNCEREPIHVPNLIQPGGALFAFDPVAGIVLHASANLGNWLRCTAREAIGKRLDDLVGAAGAARLREATRTNIGAVLHHEVFDLPADPAAGQPLALQGVLHSHQGVCIAEFEPAPASGARRDWLEPLGATIDALRGAGSLQDLAERMATRVKRLIGFDRVMVYRFAADWHGQVIADACAPDVASFLDQHFPAGDIPPQARALYRANLVRYISDIDYAAVAVNARLDPGSAAAAAVPLDLSFAMLRSVSPIHLEYLRNMGVRSTLTLSLLVEGRLWGLIACHHHLPTALPIALRRACEVLSLSAGLTVASIEQRERADADRRNAGALGFIGDAFRLGHVPLGEVVERCTGALLQIVSASAGAFWQGDRHWPFGSWPAPPRGAGIVAFARARLEAPDIDLVCTERADLQPPLTDAELAHVCGLLAVKLDPTGSSGIVWLRRELRQKIDWSGDPDRPAQVTRDARGEPYLSPRASFARREREISGRSRAWDEADLAAARSLLLLRQALVVRSSLARIDLEERRFEGLVALQSDIYWETDVQGRLVVLSRPLPGDHGLAEGRTLAELLGAVCDATGREALAAALAGSGPIPPLLVHGNTAAGDAFVLQLNGQPLRDELGQLVGWHGTLADLTQEAAMQSAQRAKEAAEFASAAKSRFLSHVTHELQTPLTTVIGFSELLLLDADLPERQREPLVLIQKAGRWLQAMIADLLDLSHVETGNLKVTMGPVDVRAVLLECLQMIRPQAEAWQVRLSFEPLDTPVFAQADAVRLKQVLLNLASNAIKYNRPAGEVRFAVSIDQPSDRVRIAIHDTGLGLTPAQRDRLFEPFNRLGRDAQNIPGTGIGLVLVKHLVGAMGGSLTVDTEPGQGSCFSVLLAAV